MASRQVTSTRIDRNGDIVALCDQGSGWSPRDKQHAVADIETGAHEYYLIHDGKRIDVSVVKGAKGSYLKATWDSSKDNHLVELGEG